MTAEPRRRWWPGSLLVLTALVLSLALLDRARSASSSSEIPRAPAVQDRARSIVQRRLAAAGHVPNQDLAPATDRRADPAVLGHLSDLDRTAEEDQLLWAAEERLVAACMHGRGFSYLPNQMDVDPNAYQEQRRTRRGDVEAARTTGYGLVDQIRTGDLPASAVDRNAESLAHMSSAERAAYLEALRGPAVSPADPSVRSMVVSVPLPGGGSAYWYRDSCLAHARRQLYGEDYEHNELGYARASLLAELLARADEDPAYRRGLDGWCSCMRERGFSEDRPTSAARRLTRQYREGKLSLDDLRAQELQIATADAECYAKVDLARIRQAAESRAEAGELAAHRDELATMMTERTDALERAERIVGEGEL